MHNPPQMPSQRDQTAAPEVAGSGATSRARGRGDHEEEDGAQNGEEAASPLGVRQSRNGATVRLARRLTPSRIDRSAASVSKTPWSVGGAWRSRKASGTP